MVHEKQIPCDTNQQQHTTNIKHQTSTKQTNNMEDCRAPSAPGRLKKDDNI